MVQMSIYAADSQTKKERGAGDFAVARFLSREFPPPVWRPVEYNALYGIRRYCQAEYTNG